MVSTVKKALDPAHMRRVFERDALRLRKRAAREEKIKSSNGLDIHMTDLNDGLSSDEDELDTNQLDEEQLKGIIERFTYSHLTFLLIRHS